MLNRIVNTQSWHQNIKAADIESQELRQNMHHICLEQANAPETLQNVAIPPNLRWIIAKYNYEL